MMLWRPHMPSQAGRRPGRLVTRTGLRPSVPYSFATLSRSPQQGFDTMIAPLRQFLINTAILIFWGYALVCWMERQA